MIEDDDNRKLGTDMFAIARRDKAVHEEAARVHETLRKARGRIHAAIINGEEPNREDVELLQSKYVVRRNTTHIPSAPLKK